MSTQKPRGQKRPAKEEEQAPAENTPSPAPPPKRSRPADVAAPSTVNTNEAGTDLMLRTPVRRFKVHKIMLALFSPVLAAKIAALPPSSGGALPELVVTEPDRVIGHLLQFMYPVSDPDLEDLDDIVALYEAASTKYSISYVTKALEKALASPRFLDTEPVRVYAIAKRFKLDELARLATRAALRQPATWPDYAEFDDMPAKHYHALLNTHRAIAREAVELLNAEDLFEAQKAILTDQRPSFMFPSTKSGYSSGMTCGCYDQLKCWWIAYKRRAGPLLLEVPSTDEVCSPAFVGSLAKKDVSCNSCRQALLYILLPGGYVEKLKEAIDALPGQFEL